MFLAERRSNDKTQTKKKKEKGETPHCIAAADVPVRLCQLALDLATLQDADTQGKGRHRQGMEEINIDKNPEESLLSLIFISPSCQSLWCLL